MMKALQKMNNEIEVAPLHWIAKNQVLEHEGALPLSMKKVMGVFDSL